MAIKAALYVRVSTQEQALEGYSLDAQQEKLKKYAEYQKYDVVGVYRDEGFSAASMARPALQRLINDIKVGKINTVLIYKLDRLSRRVKDVLELVELFIKYEVTLFSITENLDLSSPFGRAALKMSATFSELERETIIERTRLGKDQRVKEGKMLITRCAPFGYKYNKETSRFDVVPEEAEMVKKLFELYIQGYSFRKLYDYARANFGHPYFGNPMCCKAIIKRPMYAGYFLWKNELYKGTNFDAIIPYETYARAQKQVEANKTVRNHDNTPYLLTGLLVCAQCGNRYVGKLYDRYRKKPDGTESKHYKYTAYGCAARVKRDKNYHPAMCRNTIISAEQLDAAIGEKVKNFKFEKFIDGEYTPSLVESLRAENVALREKIDKLLDLYIEGIIDKETYQLRVADFEKSIEKNELVINAELDKIQATPINSIDYLIAAQENYDNLDKKEKRKLLTSLIKYIAIDGDNIVIRWRVK